MHLSCKSVVSPHKHRQIKGPASSQHIYLFLYDPYRLHNMGYNMYIVVLFLGIVWYRYGWMDGWMYDSWFMTWMPAYIDTYMHLQEICDGDVRKTYGGKKNPSKLSLISLCILVVVTYSGKGSSRHFTTTTFLSLFFSFQGLKNKRKLHFSTSDVRMEKWVIFFSSFSCTHGSELRRGKKDGGRHISTL